VFLVGANHALYTSWQTTINGSWSGWASKGGYWPTNDGIGVGNNQDGRLEVFLVGANHALYTSWQTTINGSWSGWASKGGYWPA